MEIANLIFQRDNPEGTLENRSMRGQLALMLVRDFAETFPQRLAAKADVSVGPTGIFMVMQVFYADMDDLIRMREYVEQELLKRGLGGVDDSGGTGARQSHQTPRRWWQFWE